MTREVCADIVVDGHLYRYSLSRATKPTARTVVLDVGGPGVAVLDSGGLSGFLASQTALDAVNVLTVEEPWVTRDPTAGCSAAMTAFDHAARDNDARAATVAGQGLTGACAIAQGGWGFDQRSYRAVLTAVRDRERIDYHGFVGESFGSVRLGYLADSPIADDLDWAVLHHPFPVGTSFDRLVADRAVAVHDLVRRLAPPSSGSAPGPDKDDFDAASALVELGYLTAAEQPRVARDVLSGRHPDTVAYLADQLWQRNADGQVSPGLLAEVQEICGAVHDTGSAAVRSAVVERVLAASFLPCGANTGIGAPQLGNTPVCIATVADDTVTPPPTILEALGAVSSRATWVREAAGGHRSTSGLTTCLQQLRNHTAAF
ncbi:hypothetical protein ACWKSP_23820 [Micromonosporaceae bacterium Da 78-11]